MPASSSRPMTKYELDQITLTSLRAARLIMESGGHARAIVQTARKLSGALGAEFLGFRIGYASLALSLGSGDTMTTRMIDVGRHGVNLRLNQAIRKLVNRAEKEKMSPDVVESELSAIVRTTPKHPHYFVVAAVGLACASFGQLFGADEASFIPIFIASAFGQHLRGLLHARRVNAFVSTAIIALVCGLISGYGAELKGSETTTLAMMASILLLVPGVPATNAQTDIIDGYPTTGSARAVSVLMIMVFAAAGIWLAGLFLGVHA